VVRTDKIEFRFGFSRRIDAPASSLKVKLD
jgi:hypothetical protein